jgi:sugar phosphate isomerase/epimerase
LLLRSYIEFPARPRDGAKIGGVTSHRLRVGLNPYGLAYSIGLVGAGTPRANPAPMGMAAFIELALSAGAKCVELDGRWLTGLSDQELTATGETLRDAGATVICSDWLTHVPGETLARPVHCAITIGARLLRLHLTPVVEGGRAGWGDRWDALVAHGRTTLRAAARMAVDGGLELAVENHQDFTSEELIALADNTPGVGIVLDTGNPYAVGEDPLAFIRRAGDRIRHVHLKDYVAQFTPEGYRLVRCAIGDGCVPFTELAAALPDGLTASIEPGALEARHIRLFTPAWWRGYPPREAMELATALGRLQRHRLPDDADWRTPWEQEASGPTVSEYELAQVRRSIDNVREMGWV